MFQWFFDSVTWIFWWFAAISLATTIVPWLVHTFLFKDQDLKKKYDASWALVTGASSGIGRAITEKLATQGINVVMAALPDELLEKSYSELTKKFPKIQFRKVPVVLGDDKYLAEIEKATADIPVTLIFSNAGYIAYQFFATAPFNKLMANWNCNATAGLAISHMFSSKMIKEKQRGFICFTSSPAGYLPNPLSQLYCSTKAALTLLGVSIAAELAPFGIDVLVMHPSPVHTGFFNANGVKFDMAEAFKMTATTPEIIADSMFASAGRTTLREQGYFGSTMKVIVHLIDFSFFADVFKWLGPFLADFKRLAPSRDGSSSTAAKKQE